MKVELDVNVIGFAELGDYSKIVVTGKVTTDEGKDVGVLISWYREYTSFTHEYYWSEEEIDIDSDNVVERYNIVNELLAYASIVALKLTNEKLGTLDCWSEKEIDHCQFEHMLKNRLRLYRHYVRDILVEEGIKALTAKQK